MRMRDALTELVKSLGWEAESDTVPGLVSQLSKMVSVSEGQLTIAEAPSYVAKVGKAYYASLSDAIAAAKGRTVRLMADVTGQTTIASGSSATIDLNGHTVTNTGFVFVNNGALTISGEGTVESTNDSAIVAGNDSQTTIVSGTVRSVEGAVITGKNTGATITVKGGTLSASDNAVLAGNGSGGGKNTFNVMGGTLIGAIKSASYVACGIYCPTDDVVNFTGGVMDITGGCGICARAGKAKVTGGTIHTTGSATGKVGDSRVVVPCSAIVFDSEAAYPSLSDEDGIRVTGGTLTSEADAVAFVGEKPHITISGGTFSSPVPEGCVIAGFSPKENADGTYTVGR